MEIKLNGWKAGTILGCVIAEAIIGFVALDKWKKERIRANNAETREWCRSCEVALRDFRIKDLEREIAELEKKS